MDDFMGASETHYTPTAISERVDQLRTALEKGIDTTAQQKELADFYFAWALYHKEQGIIETKDIKGAFGKIVDFIGYNPNVVPDLIKGIIENYADINKGMEEGRDFYSNLYALLDGPINTLRALAQTGGTRTRRDEPAYHFRPSA